LDELPIVEQQPFQEASSPYARTKQISEGILKDCVNAYPNLNATVLRYFNPIGAHPSALIGELPNGVPNNLVPFITQTAAGIRECLSVFGNDYNTPDGSCIRDYIYVVDLAKAHVKAVDKMLSEGTRWNVYNLGTGKGLSVLELVNAFIRATGVELKYKIAERRPGDVEQYWADPSKANRELGWSADTPIEEVLLSAWKWQQGLKG
jgi:UDP-glucose 4-epimerase